MRPLSWIVVFFGGVSASYFLILTNPQLKPEAALSCSQSFMAFSVPSIVTASCCLEDTENPVGNG